MLNGLFLSIFPLAAVPSERPAGTALFVSPAALQYLPVVSIEVFLNIEDEHCVHRALFIYEYLPFCLFYFFVVFIVFFNPICVPTWSVLHPSREAQ